MTDEEKEQRKQVRKHLAAIAAEERFLAAEKKQIHEIESVWHHINDEDRRKLKYLAIRIKVADIAEIPYLRGTRELHFRRYRRHIKEEIDAEE